MIAGIGIDIIEIRRIKDGYKKFGDNFLTKIFTDAELEYCSKFKKNFESLAGKFSVKEAFMKAIGSGIRQGVWFKDIEVLNLPTQAPYIKLHNIAQKKHQKLGSPDIHISITHTAKTAAAIVILEQK